MRGLRGCRNSAWTTGSSPAVTEKRWPRDCRAAARSSSPACGGGCFLRHAAGLTRASTPPHPSPASGGGSVAELRGRGRMDRWVTPGGDERNSRAIAEPPHAHLRPPAGEDVYSSSCAGLTRASTPSLSLPRKRARERSGATREGRWTAGSSPAVTKEIAARLPSRRTLILAGLRGRMFILRHARACLHRDRHSLIVTI